MEKVMTQENTDNNSEENQAQAGSGNEAPSMPDGLNESFWDPDNGVVKMDDLIASHNELTEFKTSHEANFENRPESAEAYELALPESFEMPEGFNFEFQPDSELAKAAMGLAFESGFSQEQFVERFLVPYANHELGKATEDHVDVEEVYREQVAALGENGKARMDAVDAYLKKNLSEEQYKAMEAMATHAHTVEALEILINQKNSTGNVNTGDGGAEGGLTEAKLDEMMDDPRYWDPMQRDDSFIKQVKDGFKKLYPGDFQRIR